MEQLPLILQPRQLQQLSVHKLFSKMPDCLQKYRHNSDCICGPPACYRRFNHLTSCTHPSQQLSAARSYTFFNLCQSGARCHCQGINQRSGSRSRQSHWRKCRHLCRLACQPVSRCFHFKYYFCTLMSCQNGLVSGNGKALSSLSPLVQFRVLTPSSCLIVPTERSRSHWSHEMLNSLTVVSSQVLGGTLTFSDGSSVTVGKLDNSGGAYTVTLPNTIATKFIKFTITAVAPSTKNIGLSEIQVFGPGTNLATGSTASEVAKNGKKIPNEVSGQGPKKAIDGKFGLLAGWPANPTQGMLSHHITSAILTSL